MDFNEIWYSCIFRKSVEKIQAYSNATGITFTLQEDLCIFIIIFRSFIVRSRNVSGKTCRENQNTYFMFDFFFLENHTIYEIMWKNKVEPNRPQTATRWMGFGWWIPKATNTHSEYVILIAFPQQQWLQNGPQWYVYMYIASLTEC